VNGGYPALAQYMPGKEGDGLVPWGIHVIETKENQILHVQNFIHTPLFSRFGLPERIDQ
jgi:RNA polymerase sigma-70 factor (ECF subfamily)